MLFSFLLLILFINNRYYDWFRGEITVWLEDVWEDLNVEKPTWFNEAAIANVPLDYIPNAEEISERASSKLSMSLTDNMRRGLGFSTSLSASMREEIEEEER